MVSVCLDLSRLCTGHLSVKRSHKETDEDTLLALENAVRGQPEIVECLLVSGESDYTLRIVSRSIGDYESFQQTMLFHLPGVASVNSRFALGCVKMTTALPLP